MVYWAHITVVEAELICLDDLFNFPGADWKYVLNLAGTELPNYSHQKLRSELESSAGQDILMSFPVPPEHYERFNETHTMTK